MKIVKLTAENIKRLVAVEITPDGNLVQITGKNGAGKTSVLDSIWWALSGTTHIQAQPIRKGQNKARVRLDLGDIVVERRFTEAGSSLTVESAEGARYPSPQGMLDKLLGELSFDPLAFSRMEPRQQFDALRRISKLSIDIDKLNAANASDFAKRTDLNRDAKKARAMADGVTVPADPGERVNVGSLVTALEEAGKANAELEQRRANRDKAAQKIADGAREVARLGAEANDLRKRALELDAQASTAAKESAALQAKLDAAPPLSDPINTSELRQKIAAAQATNDKADAFARATREKATRTEEADGLEEKSKALTASMAAREQVKADAIAAAAMPVDGLGFGDGAVTYNGIPFDQAYDAEKLCVSMSIAIASNPKLRVLRIRDGSLLDDESLALVATMAQEKDMQVWLDKVDGSGKVGVVIEDGMVAGAAVKQEAENRG